MIDIRPLTPDQADDWLDFFDRRAFADNPAWGGCYCRIYLLGPGDDDAWDAACASGENRDVMAAAIRAGEVDGLLAREDGEIVGWTHFGPTSRFHPPGGPLAPADAGVASIVCFVVAHTHRRRGVARAMLDRALDELADRGFTAVDARPLASDEHEAMELFTGPRGLYEAAGFEVVEQGERRLRMRRTL